MSGTTTTASLGGTQNRAWAADKNAYGRKMMEKMGWTDGAGLGKDGQGEKTHVRIKQRGANQALGAEAWSSEKGGGANGMANRIDAAAGQKSWMQTTDNFASLLSQLGSTYGKAHEKKKAKKDKKKKRKRNKQGDSGSDDEDGGDKGRAHAMNSAFSFRKANIRNKKVTGLSDKDMAALLGGAAPVAADEQQKREKQARRESETEEERKARKAAKKARKAAKRAREAGVVPTPAPAVVDTEEAPSAKKKQKKDKKDKKKKKNKKKDEKGK